MFINPQISRCLANERHRDLIAGAQQQTLPRQLRTGSGTAEHRRPLANRLWRRPRPVTRPRLEPQV
jgi:hypothetical protein